MGKNTSTALMFCCLSLAMCSAYAKTQCPIKNQYSRPQNLCHRKEKFAKLQLYVQDVKVGPKKTVWEVARSNVTSYSATDFGLVNVMDNKITAEPDFNSEEVGRAQAIIAFSDMEETAVTMNFNFYLTKGEYCGSSLSVVGRQALFQVSREMPIVAGTGVFRTARGYAISNTYSFEGTYGVVEYTLHVFYVEDPCFDHLVAASDSSV